MSALLLLGLAALAQTSTTAPAAITAGPADSSDLAERLIVRFGVSYDPIFGSALGSDANRRTDAQVLSGNAALGTRRLLLPMLNTYALGQAVLDLSGAPAISSAVEPDRPIHPLVAHRYPDARAFLLHLAYAELEGFSTEGVLSNFHLRAGRQFHFGQVGVTFDGATLGYDSSRFSLAVRGGQRSAPFDRTGDDPQLSATTPGTVLGGSGRLHLGDRDGLSLDVRAEYLHFTRTVGLFARDRALFGTATVDQAKDLGELVLDFTAGEDLLITARGTLVGAELSHVRLDATYQLGRTVLLLDFDQKVGPELLFGLASGTGAERLGRRTTFETFRLNIPDAQPYSDVRGTVLFDVTDWLELQPMGGARIVLADAADQSPYDASRIVWGLAASARLPAGHRAGLEIYADYSAAYYLRTDSGQFRDNAAGGESMLHDVDAGVRYVRRGEQSLAPRDGRLLSHRTLSTGVYGFLSASRFDGRYFVDPLDQLTAGGGTDVRWTLDRVLTLSLAFEVARGPATFFDDLGLFYGLRGGVAGQF